MHAAQFRIDLQSHAVMSDRIFPAALELIADPAELIGAGRFRIKREDFLKAHVRQLRIGSGNRVEHVLVFRIRGKVTLELRDRLRLPSQGKKRIAEPKLLRRCIRGRLE